ncbi:MAG: OmpA family protein, partial [Chlamydiota bacterium]
RVQFVDGAIPQPKNSPGERGSRIPGVDGFHTPVGSEAAIFKNVYFKTDDHILRDKEYLSTIERISAYLKSHPDTYLFVSGNCDQRGPEAYNLSLGARRANYVRTLLVQKGVDAEQIHTISYGKERLLDTHNNAEAWSKNRRAEFKIYQK